ncbi:FAD-binding oxidoreductase [Thermocatellispora tengchongensis]|uniref:FAD-binding oxidoreductase n=1 Tax=Thermocatellispora tengchongensis TaxID=1073253 RepID=UPI0036320D46
MLVPGDPALADGTAAFNTAWPVRPIAVVAAADEADVAAAVRWAAARRLPVAVQATGHGLVAPVEDAVLVTTSRLSHVRVDPVSRTARVGAGVRWAQVIEAAAPHGLAPLNGSTSHVGVAGYTLGGGLGLMARRYGFAADHVRRLRLVTADGAIREVDATTDPELFWAVRGGKGDFGIVTEIEFGLVPVTTLYGGGVYFPGQAAAEVLHAYRQWVETLPEDTTTSVGLLRLPPDPALPEPLRGRFVVHLRYAHLGSAEEGAALLAPMRSAAPRLIDSVGEMPYTAVDSIYMDPTDPMPCHDRGTALSALPAEAVDRLLAVAGPGADVPVAMVDIRHMGGALARPAAVPNAVAGRDAAFSVYALGVLLGPAAGAVPAAVGAVIDAVAPWSSGSLINFLGPADRERVRSLWPEADLARLLAAKRRVDPYGIFTTGHSIG